MILRPYQIEISDKAAELIKKHKIAYLSMQVRTGKTLTALETVTKCHKKNVLFVTKKKAIGSIQADYEHYKNRFKMLVINYEQLHNIHDDYDMIIVDEAHSLGQYPKPSERTIELKKICFGKPIIYLSGTPSPESYSQLFNQFWISSFSPFPHSNFYQWCRSGYVQIGVRYFFNRQIPDYKNARKDMIDDKIKHLFISYTQEEAGFKEDVKEIFHEVLLSPIITHLIHKLRRDRVVYYPSDDNPVIEADTEVKLMNKLHQMYSGTVITDNGTKLIDYAKINYIGDKFKGKKIALYYKFKGELDIITQYCKKYCVPFTENINEFNEMESGWFVSQIQSGREGINLSSADCMVMYNIDFAAVSYWQARARLQSKDRIKSVEVHWIFAKDGIEKNIYKAVNNKKNYTLSYFKKDEKNIASGNKG